MALTIWGRHTSSNVQKLLWGCAEMGVAYDRPDMAGAFGFTDEYLAMNPNRLVPTIDDDGFILWESNACLRYLAEKHGRGTLWPEDPHSRRCGPLDGLADGHLLAGAAPVYSISSSEHRRISRTAI